MAEQRSASAGNPSKRLPTTLEEYFDVFSKFGSAKGGGGAITLSNLDKWFKQAKVIDKKITTTDTGIYFKKVSKNKKTLTWAEFQEFLDVLSKNKKADVEEVKAKLGSCGAPGFSQATVASKDDAVARLTDTAKYTGSHKERFDETGKGRGIEGREYTADASGYVHGYKHQDTYDHSH